MVLEKTLENPLDIKEIKPVSLKGNQPWTLIGRTDAEAEVPIFWPPDAKSQFTEKENFVSLGETKSQPKRRGKLLGEFIDISGTSFQLPHRCSSRNLIYLLITNRKTPLRPGIAPHPEPRPVAPGPLCRMWIFFPRPDPLQNYSAWLFTTHISAVNCVSIFLPASLSPWGRHVTCLWHFLHVPPSFPPSLRSWASSKRKFPSDSVNWYKRSAVLIRICLLRCLFQLWSKFKSSFFSFFCVSGPPKKQQSRSKWKCLILLCPRNMSIWRKVQEKVCFLLLSLLLHRMVCRF